MLSSNKGTRSNHGNRGREPASWKPYNSTESIRLSCGQLEGIKIKYLLVCEGQTMYPKWVLIIRLYGASKGSYWDLWSHSKHNYKRQVWTSLTHSLTHVHMYTLTLDLTHLVETQEEDQYHHDYIYVCIPAFHRDCTLQHHNNIWAVKNLCIHTYIQVVWQS